MSSSTIALVTGANASIGEAIARRLAVDAGYTVLIGSRSLAAGESVAASLRAQGHSAAAIQLDLVSDESIDAAVETIRTKYGKLDVLVHNASVLFDNDPEFADKRTTLRGLFEKTFATNVFGIAVLTEALTPLLRAAAVGDNVPRLVFVSSQLSSMHYQTDKVNNVHRSDQRAYNSSKAALNNLALNTAFMLEDVGAKVNVVCPGWVKSRMNGFNPQAGTTEEGSQRAFEMATVGKDGPTTTFSNRFGPCEW